MASHKLTLVIESARPEQEHVSLTDFLFQLTAFRKILSNTESLVAKREPVIDWQIIDLSQSSPAQVVLRSVHTDSKFSDVSGETVEKVFRYLEVLSTEAEVPSEMNRKTLEAYQTFGDRIHKGVLRTRVENEKDAIEVSEKVQDKINITLSPQIRAIGMVEGRLEYVNIHGNRNVFRIYPTIGSNKVECTFPTDRLKDARDALDRRIRVYGKLTYLARSSFPSSIEVDRIKMLPEDDELPSLLDLRGTAPDITGVLSSEEFVRRLRSAE